MDVLFGYSSIKNEKLLSNYNTNEYSGAAFVWDIGFGYCFINPLFVRLAFAAHVPIGHTGLNTAYVIQLGYRIR